MIRSVAARVTRQSLSYAARPVQFAVASRRPTAVSTLLSNSRLNPGIVRNYGHGPPPLTREFVQERIIDLLGSYDKVSYHYAFNLNKCPGCFEYLLT